MRIDKNGNPWISISEFNVQSYCEVQLKFIWQGIKIETKKMLQGSEVHQDKFQQFEEETKDLERVDIVTAIKRAIEKQETFVGREVFIVSPTFRIKGVIDSIEIRPEGILISDDKPIDYPYISTKSQVVAYATAFKDRYRPPLDIFMMIKNRDKESIVWEEVFSQEWLDFMLEKINRMHELALGKREFEPTKNIKKCLSCSYREMCDRKIRV
jgi:CRISPR/Cas system-associated exonuclease Cas4 (RecB family)